MRAVVTAAGANESELAKLIKACIAKGEAAERKAEQFFIAAGQHLKTLKELHDEHGGSWAEWERLVKDKCGIGKSRASELMRIADGRTTVEEVRAEKAESVRKVRAAIPPLRSGETETTPAPAPSQQRVEEIITLAPPESDDYDAETAALSAPGSLAILQRVWDVTPHDIRQQFAAANAVELQALLAHGRSRTDVAAVVDRAMARSQSSAATVTPPGMPPIGPDLPEFLDRAAGGDPKGCKH